MQASYALGYNLAIEYLADYEKTWMLDSFRQLDSRVLQPQQRALKEWLFLEVIFCPASALHCPLSCWGRCTSSRALQPSCSSLCQETSSEQHYDKLRYNSGCGCCV